jgi:hypothetical protein
MTLPLRLFRLATALICLIAAMAALASMGLFCLFLVAAKDLPRVPEPIGRINDTPPQKSSVPTGGVF